MPPASASNHDARVSQDKEIDQRLGQVGTKTGRTVFALSNPFDGPTCSSCPAILRRRSGSPRPWLPSPRRKGCGPNCGTASSVLAGVRRTYKNLDERERADLIEDLKRLDNEISAAPVWAVRQIMEWQKGLTKQEKMDFTLAIALPDLMRELEDAERGLYADNPGGIPFYGRGEEETRSVGEVLALVKADYDKLLRRMTRPTRRAVERREDWHNDFTAELVKANLLERDVLKDNRYFHRMVLKYLDSQNHRLRPGWHRRPAKKVPAQFQRVGGGDFSLNFLMAEMEYIASMQVQMSKVAALGRIDQEHNISQGLRDQATNINGANMDTWWAQEIALEQDPEVAAEMARLGWDHEYRKRMAMNSSWLAERLAKGEIEGTPFAGMEEAANEQWRKYLEDLEEYKEDREDGLEGMARPPSSSITRTGFPSCITWPAGSMARFWYPSKSPTRPADAQPRRRSRILASMPCPSSRPSPSSSKDERNLGRKYRHLEGPGGRPGGLPSLATQSRPPGRARVLRLRQCDHPGPHRRRDCLRRGHPGHAPGHGDHRIRQDQTRPYGRRAATGMGPAGGHRRPVGRLGDHVLERAGKDTVSHGLQFATGAWKRIILFGPWRWLKYEFNNMSGDLDAALTHPGILKEAPRAAKDLWGWLNQTPGQAAKSAGLFSVLVGSAVGAAVGGIPGAIFGAGMVGIGGATIGGAARAMMSDPEWNLDTGTGDNEREWQRLERMGVIDSGQLMNEVAANGWDQAYDLLSGKKPFTLNPLKIAKRGVQGYANSVRNFNAWREGVLRVAAARYFLKKLGGHHVISGKKARKTVRKGDGMVPRRYYGASRKDAMDVLYDQVEDLEERHFTGDQAEENWPEWDEVVNLREEIAARLARELIGDYGAISETGRSLRRGLAPFWAWQEVNFPRYMRLFKNSIAEGGNGASRGIVLGTGMAIKSTIAIGALTMMVNAFNEAMKAALDIPDEEDPNAQPGRGQWIIVGRYDDGTIKKIKFSGAFLDAMGWFALDDYLRHEQNLKRAWKRDEIGAGIAQVAADVGKAPVQRLADTTTPLIKTPVELFGGQRYYPDLFRPRKIKDRMDHLFSTGGLSAPYRVWAKTASVEMIANGLIYEETPGASSYWRTRELVMDHNEGKTEDSRQRTFTITQAKSAWSRKDEERARHWLKSYWSTPGVTWRGFQTSLRNSHPLNYIAKKDRPAFLASLDEEDRRLVHLATKWYEETAVGSKGFLALAEDEARRAGIEIPEKK